MIVTAYIKHDGWDKPLWTRTELKTNAKGVLKYCYWESVAVILISLVISSAATLVGTALPFGGIAATIFLALPLNVGINFYFIQNQKAPPRIQNVFYPFERGRYLKIVGAMTWMFLFIFLWLLISFAGFFIVLTKWISTIIPFVTTQTDLYKLLDSFSFDSSWIPIFIASGIIYIAGMINMCIKSLSYSMTAYILTDNPFIGSGRALKLSMAMTHGQKWRMFVLYLSFIGWALLAALTLGIGTLFLAPYISATQAQLYLKLRDSAISCGLVTAQELNVNANQ